MNMYGQPNETQNYLSKHFPNQVFFVYEYQEILSSVLLTPVAVKHQG